MVYLTGSQTASTTTFVRPHTASAVVMVPPKHFKFNAETSADNEFQHSVSLTDQQIKAKTMAEFTRMVVTLRRHGVDVVVMDYPDSDAATPDAVFPNNWFNTTPDGEVYLFPMACENRRREVKSDLLAAALDSAGYLVNYIHPVGDLSAPKSCLESTGVMIMDHQNRTVYGALSNRCEKQLMSDWAMKAGYDEVFSFHTEMSSGHPVYHTNVMMSVGEGFAVICDAVIDEFERRRVISELEKSKEVFFITETQMASFCGNVLQLQNGSGERLIAMSLSAYNAFTNEQKRKLRKHGKLLPFDVATIETIGGGSVRCMLAEVFLPKIQ